MSLASIKVASSLLAIFLLTGLQAASSADAKAGRGGATFGDKPSFQSSDDLEFVLSPDKQAVTITFGSFFEAATANDKLPAEAARRARSTPATAPIVTRAFSMVLPVTGDKPVRTSLFASGFALTGPDSTATLLFVVNGQHKVVRFGPNTERSFVEKIDYRGGRTSEIRMNVFLLAERSSSNPNGLSFLRVVTIDTDTALAARKTASRTKN